MRPHRASSRPPARVSSKLHRLPARVSGKLHRLAWNANSSCSLCFLAFDVGDTTILGDGHTISVLRGGILQIRNINALGSSTTPATVGTNAQLQAFNPGAGPISISDAGDRSAKAGTALDRARARSPADRG